MFGFDFCVICEVFWDIIFLFGMFGFDLIYELIFGFSNVNYYEDE